MVEKKGKENSTLRTDLREGDARTRERESSYSRGEKNYPA